MQIVHELKHLSGDPDLGFLNLDALGSPSVPFEDNLEAVQALESEARLLLTVGRKRIFASIAPADMIEAEAMATYDGSMVDSCSETRLLELLEASRTTFKRRATLSRKNGVEIFFETLCATYDLDTNERAIVLLLFMCSSSQDFRSFFERLMPRASGFDAGGMDVATLLTILSDSLKGQLSMRRYFSADSRLLQRELAVHQNGSFGQASSVLDQVFILDQRVANFIIGDHNMYNLELACIRKEMPRVRMEQVVLDEKIKGTIIEQAESFLSRNSSHRLEKFYGYGTGLTYFFHGPSGTGKTMLAHALASRLGAMLFNINTQTADSMRLSIKEVVAYVFREARLSKGIVFFDECDDMFMDGTPDSQALLTEIEKAGCITILATNKQTRLDPALQRRINMKVEFDLPTQKQRTAIWKALKPDTIQTARNVDFTQLARDYIFSGGLIKNAWLMAVNHADGGIVDMHSLAAAADYQASSLAADIELGSFYKPSTKLHSLALHPLDKRKVKQLSRCINGLDATEQGCCTLLQCDHLPTGIDIADALAGAGKLHVARFSLDKVLNDFHPFRNELRAPISQADVTSVEYLFSPYPGFRSVTTVVDHSNVLEPVLKGEADSDNDIQSLLFELAKTSKTLVLITRRLPISHLPAGIDHVVRIAHPSEAMQIEAWHNVLPEGLGEEPKIISFVERYPLHLREIEHFAQQARTASFIRTGSEGSDFFDQLERLVRRNRTAAPLLFGHGAQDKKRAAQQRVNALGHAAAQRD